MEEDPNVPRNIHEQWQNCRGTVDDFTGTYIFLWITIPSMTLFGIYNLAYGIVLSIFS